MMANIFRNVLFDIVDMNKNFNIFNTKLEILTKLEVGDKIGFDSSEHIYINHKSIFQPFIRKYYDQNRQTTIQHMENIMGEYKIFLEMVYSSVVGKTICDLLSSKVIQKNLPNNTILLNDKIINGLRNLSITYKEHDDICQSIETIITDLNEYKSKINRAIYFQS
jgi:hypothetical protein